MQLVLTILFIVLSAAATLIALGGPTSATDRPYWHLNKRGWLAACTLAASVLCTGVAEALKVRESNQLLADQKEFQDASSRALHEAAQQQQRQLDDIDRLGQSVGSLSQELEDSQSKLNELRNENRELNATVQAQNRQIQEQNNEIQELIGTPEVEFRASFGEEARDTMVLRNVGRRSLVNIEDETLIYFSFYFNSNSPERSSKQIGYVQLDSFPSYASGWGEEGTIHTWHVDKIQEEVDEIERLATSMFETELGLNEFELYVTVNLCTIVTGETSSGEEVSARYRLAILAGGRPYLQNLQNGRQSYERCRSDFENGIDIWKSRQHRRNFGHIEGMARLAVDIYVNPTDDY